MNRDKKTDLPEPAFERVARALDGERIELSDDEQRLMDEVRSAERELGARLDADAPTPALLRARRRMQVALTSRPERRWRGLAAVTSAAVAAAAMILLAVGLSWLGDPTGRIARNETQPLPVTVMIEAYEVADDEFTLQADLLADDLAEEEVELALNHEPWLLDSEIETLEQEVQTFWME